MSRALHAAILVTTLAGCAERAPAGVDPFEAVASIRAQLDGRPAICSGVLVAPRTVVTAAHCRPLADAPGAVVDLGGERHTIAATERHLERDLALVTLDRPSAVTPLAIAPVAVVVGDAVLVASARDGGWHADHAVTELDASHVVAAGDPRHAVCAGDSGGPLLVERDGRLAVLGVLSTGSFDCRGGGTFARLDAARDWLPARLE